MNYIYLFWKDNLGASEPQQVLFAMGLPSVWKHIRVRRDNYIHCAQPKQYTMNESKNPNLKWFEIQCGTFRVGTWATSEREATKIVKSCNYLPQKPKKKYGSNRAEVTIVI